jgi:hypothetical protein
MRVCNFLRQEQAVARDCVLWVKIRLGEYSRYTKPRKRCEGHRYFIWLEIFTGERTPGSIRVLNYGRPVFKISAHLYRMLHSTDNRSKMDPVYGDPGVDSSIYRPYSG